MAVLALAGRVEWALVPPNTRKSYDDIVRLAILARDGDSAARETLFRSIESTVRSTARALVDMAHGMELEDIAQESLIHLQTGLGSFDPEKSRFYPWLIRIIKNTAHSMGRTPRRRQKDYPTASMDEELDEERTRHDMIAGECPTPYAIVCRAQAREVVFNALREIENENYRLAVFATCALHLPQRDVAEILDRRLGTVKSDISRGIEEFYKAFSRRFQEASEPGREREVMDALEQVLRLRGMTAIEEQADCLTPREQKLFDLLKKPDSELAAAGKALNIPFKDIQTLFLSGAARLISKVRSLTTGQLPAWEDISPSCIEQCLAWVEEGTADRPVVRALDPSLAVLPQMLRILALSVPSDARLERPPSPAEDLARLMKDKGWTIEQLAGHLGTDVHGAAARLAGRK